MSLTGSSKEQDKNPNTSKQQKLNDKHRRSVLQKNIQLTRDFNQKQQESHDNRTKSGSSDSQQNTITPQSIYYQCR